MKKRYSLGFTLIELIVVVSIIGFITTVAVVNFMDYRAKGRDTKRIADVETLRKALNLYLNNNAGYPVMAAGQCLSNTLGVGLTLRNAKAITQVPTDVKWAASAPTSVSATQPRVAIAPSSNFCYWYWGNITDFRISYYLEKATDGKPQGINFVSSVR